MVWPLIMAALGYGMSAYGEHQGADALLSEKKAALNRDLGFDQQRQAQLGQFIQQGYGTPVGAADEAYAAEGANVMDRAGGRAVADIGGSALGVPTGRMAPGVQPGARVMGRQMGAGRRGAADAIRRARLGASLSDIQTQQDRADALEPGREADAAKTGGGYRQLGSLATMAGNAWQNYQMAYPSQQSATKYQV